MRARRFAATRSMCEYNEPDYLRHENAATRVYACVLYILDTRWTESQDRGSQYAAHGAEDTAFRALVEHDPERYVDPVTGALDAEAITRYVRRTVSLKGRGTWRYSGTSLDEEMRDEDGRLYSDVIGADPFDTLCAGTRDADPVIDEIVRWHADHDDLREFAAERRRDAAEETLAGAIVRDWVEARPHIFKPEVAEALALRAEGYGFKAIAERLAPDGDPASLKKAAARARKHVDRGSERLPAPIAAYLPPPNRHGSE